MTTERFHRFHRLNDLLPGPRALLGCCCGLLLAGAGCDQSPTAQPGSQAVAAGTSDEQAPAPAARSKSAPGDAADLLEQVAETYREAPALSDDFTLIFRTSRGTQTYEHSIAFGAGKDVTMDLGDWVITVVGDKLYMTRTGVPHKYLEMDAGTDINATVMELTRGRGLPMHVGLRWSEDLDSQLAGLTLSRLLNPKVAGMAESKTEDGRSVYDLTIHGDNGSALIRIDPQTRLVLGSRLTYQVTRGTMTQDLDLETRFNPTIERSPSTPITFEPGDRFKVSSMQALSSATVGEPAADFTLPVLDGETFTLSEHRGEVVVLDFWATWCGPCRRGLPLLDQFHVWAESSGLPVKVYAVDVWERVPTVEAKREKVAEYWKSEGFKVPTLLDYHDDAVKPFGFTSIPTTVIIGPDGRVANIHRGYDPNMVETLKREVQRLVGQG